MVADLRPIYEAPTAEEAARQLDTFEAKWAGKYPSIAPAWRRAWAEVIPFYAFSAAIRKIIYTTNAVESLNRVLRKTLKTKGSFPTEEAATKLIFLAIRNFEKGGRAVREWVAARNQLAILFAGRFDAWTYLKIAWARSDTQSFRHSRSRVLVAVPSGTSPMRQGCKPISQRACYSRMHSVPYYSPNSAIRFQGEHVAPQAGLLISVCCQPAATAAPLDQESSPAEWPQHAGVKLTLRLPLLFTVARPCAKNCLAKFAHRHAILCFDVEDV